MNDAADPKRREAVGQVLVLFASEVLYESERVVNLRDLRIDYDKWLDAAVAAYEQAPVAEWEQTAKAATAALGETEERLAESQEALRQVAYVAGTLVHAQAIAVEALRLSPTSSPTERGSE
jgi:hypothetical protein